MSDPDRPILRPDQRPWQFSLRALLVVTAVVAVLCSALVSFGGLLFGLLLLLVTLAVPAVLVTIAVHGSSYQRTFCIGALFPSVYLCLRLPLLPYEPMVLVFGHEKWERIAPAVVFWAMAVGIGFLCVAVRRHIEKTARRDPADVTKDRQENN